MSFFFISGAKKVTIIEKRVYNQQCHSTATYYIYENYSYGRMTQLGLVTRLLLPVAAPSDTSDKRCPIP